MSLKRVLILGVIALSTAPTLAQAPAPGVPASKQMRFIVPFPAGGTLDVLARTVSNELGPALGATIVVENRPGASGVLGADVVARAPADGSTLVIVSNTFVTLPAMLNNLPFDIFKNFAPVVELGGTPTLLTVHPSFPARDLRQFIDFAKNAKDGINYNSPGIASPPHLAGELLARAADIRLVHVPYRGTQPAVTDLVAGQMPVSMAPLNAVLQFVNDRKLYGIALTDAARTKYLPEVPTLREAGITNMPSVTSWFAVLTTGGTPSEAVARLNEEINKILRDPKVQERLESQTFEIKGGSVEEIAKRMREDAATNAKIVAEANIRAN
ncbi:MAG TPA: tripartite tricarboxylate transporter substrate-binding protein [Xanthobacteraceae bacterium]|nr:tripartite tricarboxylate transporter substrate-binding protein [Xanthobacteraceae bacterium]